jgi:hypothetical protein
MVSMAVVICLTFVAAGAVRADTLGPWYGDISVRAQMRYIAPYGGNPAGTNIDAREACNVSYQSSDGHVWTVHLSYSGYYTRKVTVAGITTTYTEKVGGTRDDRLRFDIQSSPYKAKDEPAGKNAITYSPYVVDMVVQTTLQSTNSPLVRSVRHVSATCHDILPFYATYPGEYPASGNMPHRQYLLDTKTDQLVLNGVFDREFGTVSSTLTLFRNYSK